MKKQKPFFDHETAERLFWMREFIVHAEEVRQKVNDEPLRSIRYLQAAYDDLNPTEEEKRKYFAMMGHIDPIDRLRHDFWKSGGTDTLFENLGNRDFWNRFRGFLNPPVTEEEIKDKAAGE
ncbi:MAG: hypothetical protein LBK62_12325 [Treponema sp.]|jgi:hypothetical protein|nr:hypothetical protein [Treponema sp.]